MARRREIGEEAAAPVHTRKIGHGPCPTLRSQVRVLDPVRIVMERLKPIEVRRQFVQEIRSHRVPIRERRNRVGSTPEYPRHPADFKERQKAVGIHVGRPAAYPGPATTGRLTETECCPMNAFVNIKPITRNDVGRIGEARLVIAIWQPRAKIAVVSRPMWSVWGRGMAEPDRTRVGPDACSHMIEIVRITC